MFATILTLLVVGIAIYLLKKKSDKEAAKKGGLPNTYGGGGEPKTTDTYSDGGSDPTRDGKTGESKGG